MRKSLLKVSALVMLACVAIAAVVLWRDPYLLIRGEFARQRIAAGLSRASVEAAGHRWAYAYRDADAADAPTLVMVHGFTGSKENWYPLARALGGRYRLLIPDLPGWGDSERQDGADYGPVMQAQRLAEFLKMLPDKPALLVGHSMGGQIVGLLAARFPGLVDKVSLMSSAGVRFNENAFANAVLAGENPYQVGNRAELKRFLGIVFTDPPFVPWPVDKALVRRRKADAAFEQQVLEQIGRGPDALLLEDQLGRIHAPVLLLWCRDDKVIDVSAADTFRNGLRDSTTVLLSGCGHMPLMAQPRQVAEAFANFLAAPAAR